MSPFSLVAVAVLFGGIMFSLVRRVLFSLVMAVVIAVVFAVEVLESRVVLSPMVLELAFQPIHLAAPASWYTVFTSMFLHANFTHLIFNMIALILIGPLLEEKIGTPRFATIYLVTGVIGTLTFGLMHLNEPAIVLGASGAISGILGAFAILFPREKISMLYMFIPLPPMRVPFIVAIIVVLETLFALDPRSFTANEAHLGGLAAGILLAPLVMRVGPTRKESHVTGLEQLAVTDELKGILWKIEQESLEDVRRAWFEEFLQRARCPKCGGSLRCRGRSVYSDCGWSTKVRRKE